MSSIALILQTIFHPIQVENKAENEVEEGDKVQEGENERNTEKEQDSEVAADTKPGNGSQLFPKLCQF